MGFLDYAILAIYLLAVLGSGLCFRVTEGSHTDFFLAGRSMGWFPIGPCYLFSRIATGFGHV